MRALVDIFRTYFPTIFPGFRWKSLYPRQVLKGSVVVPLRADPHDAHGAVVAQAEDMPIGCLRQKALRVTPRSDL